jgi:hypothetical protein
MIPIEITLITNKSGPVNKKITLGPDGKLQKTGVGCIFAGSACRVQMEDFHQIANGLPILASNHAIALGRMAPHLPDDCILTTKQNLANMKKRGEAIPENLFARVRESIIYAPGLPAPVAIDFDVNGINESVKARIAEHGGLIGALEHICPGFKDAAYLSRGSTSSGITIEDTGEHLKGGEHHFVILSDGADAQRFIEDLFARAWLAGMGWIQIGLGGQLLTRSIIDACVWDPARLVFEANPTLGPGLHQGPRPVTVHDGLPLVCPPGLTEAEHREVAQLIEAEKVVMQAAGDAQRAIWAEGHIAKMVARGTSIEKARETVEQWSKGFLLPDAILEFKNKEIGFVPVGEILADPWKYDEEICEHPIDGREYSANGKFFAESMTIFTFGHAGQVFYLRHEAEGTPPAFRGNLGPETIIDFADPNIGKVTVAQILAMPELYDGEKCFDPHYGREGKGKYVPAIFYSKRMIIYTNAHGKGKYTLQPNYWTN